MKAEKEEVRYCRAGKAMKMCLDLHIILKAIGLNFVYKGIRIQS